MKVEIETFVDVASYILTPIAWIVILVWVLFSVWSMFCLANIIHAHLCPDVFMGRITAGIKGVDTDPKDRPNGLWGTLILGVAGLIPCGLIYVFRWGATIGMLSLIAHFVVSTYAIRRYDLLSKRLKNNAYRLISQSEQR